MKLSELLTPINKYHVEGDVDVEVSFLSQDTRDVFSESTLYFAVKGSVLDGHNYITEAISKGANVIVCQTLPKELNTEVCYVLVEDVSSVIGYMASVFYGNPSLKMKIIAVTGTNGKTSVATSLYQALQALGNNPSLLSSVHNIINSNLSDSKHTTGSPIALQKHMAEAYEQGCDYVCMEASSHALDQHRLNGVDVDIAIFTNLTQDHLDYHKTMENYAQSKQQLFSMLGDSKVSIVNIDDSYAQVMIENTRSKILTYGKNESDFSFKLLNTNVSGTEFLIKKMTVNTHLIGLFNVYNMTAVYAALSVLGIHHEQIVSSFHSVLGARGRLEITRINNDITGIIDFAHTPDALKNVLETIKKIPHRKIITIFGCGGDRDKDKRHKMAAVVELLSDIIIVTSDNPRTEDPLSIVSDIEKGFTKSSTGHAVVIDREEAIRRSVAIAKKGDIILLAGKGHENYQIMGNHKLPFNDKKILEHYLSI